MNGLRHFDYLKSINADAVQEIYERYLQDPESIDPSWRYFFDGVYLGEASASFRPSPNPNAVSNEPSSKSDEVKVYQLIQSYRQMGHHFANVNPLEPPQSNPTTLALSNFDLNESHLNQTYSAGKMIGLPPSPLSAIIERLKTIYLGTIGFEIAQIQNPAERDWLRDKIEQRMANPRVDTEDRKFLLARLTDSEALEKFIHTRYVAQKRFSIEGGESLIPALDAAIEKAAELGAKETALGMAHRGRLNVLVNTMGKSPESLFSEFDDNYRLSTDHGEGDVKYHKGQSRDFATRQGRSMHLTMGFNPSHLEFIGPVVMGVTKAKQHLRRDESKNKVFSIVMHGDAAFSGQGVVYETLQSSQLEGYSVGGTLHIISNNQVGFTTDPIDSRSTRYCTDLARMLDAPVFHVNSDDPEAVWIATQLAVEFRYQFQRDVFIDLICYRKYGHNEGDEPAFTQPNLYRKIASHPTTRELYAQRLAQEGTIPAEEGKSLFDLGIARLQTALDWVRAQKPEPLYSEYQGGVWSKYHSAHGEELFAPIPTGISQNTLVELAQRINRFPASFKVHPKLERLFDARIKTVEQGWGIDWGNAEVLAYASLVFEGASVRMTGQDVRRGTFTHRHATVFDFNSNEGFTPINQLHDNAKLLIHNSHLSETAVMGFEFGWSIADPDSLVVWEAQFGDFANGAQVIIDQFLSTSETKWHRATGLTLLLPHGFEGQGPEHSSARIERFLQLCGKSNMTVAYPSTPAQIFHLLRRQVKRTFRKPLVVMTPKSLLRHPKAVSTLQELADGGFQEVLDDPNPPTDATRVMICSGKIFYELLEEREARKANPATTAKQKPLPAIIRLEQFYPWPETLLAQTLERYPHAKEIFFVQEEPRNMGAWLYFQGMWTGALSNFGVRFPKLGLTYVGREICASTAVGSKKLHDQEQKEIILKAFQD